MQRLFIANRSEIALRIVRTARERGLETVVAVAPEDRALAEGYGADTLAALPGRGAAAYLDVEALASLAAEHDCDALHPGYGFASESAALAAACAAGGVRFVGPRPETLELFGDKSSARRHAVEQNVPVVPGVAAPAGIDAVEDFLASEGAPVLLKAVAGGGGRGMRRLDPGDDVSAAHARCASEALRAFGSDVLFAERWIDRARHVEVQIVADRDGGVGHLWERDCSVQRRHQKLIEIAPAPDLDANVRARVVESAVALAKAAGYEGLGTFEFLVTPDGEAFFMEANPRLQVEHTVTEAVTDVDLVGVQLDLAAGLTLAEIGLATPPTTRGYAIQCRLLAERLAGDGDVRPSGEPLAAFRPPAGLGVRVDSAMREGLAAHPAFDSLIGKLVVAHPADDFEATRRRTRRALSEWVIEGPRTNRGLLAAIPRAPRVRHAEALDALRRRRGRRARGRRRATRRQCDLLRVRNAA